MNQDAGVQITSVLWMNVADAKPKLWSGASYLGSPALVPDDFSVLFLQSQSINLSEIWLGLSPFRGTLADSVRCVLGHVGVPIACNHVKLEDVADMNYFAVNNEGQVGRLCRAVIFRQSQWGHLHQKKHTIVNRFVFDSIQNFSKEFSVSEPNFPVPTMGIKIWCSSYISGKHQMIQGGRKVGVLQQTLLLSPPCTILCADLHQGHQCVQGIPEGP